MSSSINNTHKHIPTDRYIYIHIRQLYIMSDDYEENENRMAEQEKEDWENREMYGIEW